MDFLISFFSYIINLSPLFFKAISWSVRRIPRVVRYLPRHVLVIPVSGRVSLLVNGYLDLL